MNSGVLYDLVIKCDRIFCSECKLDGPGEVAIRNGRIVSSGETVSTTIEKVDFRGALLLPGLIDMHAHPARGGSRYGVDPDIHCLPRGVTTILSQGDAGAKNWLEYCEKVIRKSKSRVLMAINLCKAGESHSNRCFMNIDDADVDACISAIENGDDFIWGISLNTSVAACGKLDAKRIMSRGLEVAEKTGLPLLLGSRMNKDWPLEEQLPLLRSGDVMTYCFNSNEENVLRNGKIMDAVSEARERGVLFDLGHGMASFSFPVAEAAIADGFLPDTISTDQYNQHLNKRPTHDLPRTMSKLIAAGMSENEVLVRTTANPAKHLGLAGEIGTLAPGSCADITVIRWNEESSPLQDVNGIQRPGGCWEPIFTVRAGKIV